MKPYWFKVEPNGSGGAKQILVLDEERVHAVCNAPRHSLNLSIFRSICTELGIKIEVRNASRR